MIKLLRDKLLSYRMVIIAVIASIALIVITSRENYQIDQRNEAILGGIAVLFFGLSLIKKYRAVLIIAVTLLTFFL